MSLVVSGIVGALVMSMLMAMAPKMGMPKMDIVALLTEKIGKGSDRRLHEHGAEIEIFNRQPDRVFVQREVMRRRIAGDVEAVAFRPAYRVNRRRSGQVRRVIAAAGQGQDAQIALQRHDFPNRGNAGQAEAAGDLAFVHNAVIDKFRRFRGLRAPVPMRLAGVVASLFLLLFILFASSLIEQIPVAAQFVELKCRPIQKS